MRILGFDAVPDPDELRFVLDRPLISGSVTYGDPSDARTHPVARAVLDVHGVAAVTLENNTLTVLKYPDSDWPILLPQIQAAISGSEGERPSAM
ncbi:MAG: NifU N-terminal domain-containing protein [Myxococcales bacterium]